MVTEASTTWIPPVAKIAQLESRVKELEAERVRDGLAGQAALDEANNRIRELEVKLEREIGLANDAYKRAGIRWKQYDAEKQDHEITKLELFILRAERDALREATELANAKISNYHLECHTLRAERDSAIRELSEVGRKWGESVAKEDALRA
jgi:hypothetical protein